MTRGSRPLLTSATEPDAVLYLFDDRPKGGDAQLVAVDRDANQRVAIDLRADQLDLLISELQRFRDSTPDLVTTLDGGTEQLMPLSQAIQLALEERQAVTESNRLTAATLATQDVRHGVTAVVTNLSELSEAMREALLRSDGVNAAPKTMATRRALERRDMVTPGGFALTDAGKRARRLLVEQIAGGNESSSRVAR